ncbi:MAG: alpha-glucosidase/alpha-galactosidase [Phycisphaeraceae bacterium]|nr:alpha-glucosidase/alpha-galactosidase [Phycisphaeraceae bacterium]
MPKITFIGAGSTIFAKNILGDCMLSEPLRDASIALYDIDGQRLEDSRLMLENLNTHINEGRSRISCHLGVENRRAAMEGADYVVNAIQVGGYKPSTVIDFEVPKKYGLGQTIGDTLGIGGIFRGLRTIPVMLDIGRDMERCCPEALLLNYTNPMAMVTGAFIEATGLKAVGLCHSVPGLARGLLRRLDMWDQVKKLHWHVAGINHQAWLLEIRDGEKDLYPEIKRRAAEGLARVKAAGGGRKFYEDWKAARIAEGQHVGRYHDGKGDAAIARDMVRLELMMQLGHYMTEGSIHTAEYVPWFIKNAHPELLDIYNIPLDEYLDRCVDQIEGWNAQRDQIVHDAKLEHKRSSEYGSYIMEAMETDQPFRIHGNVLNTGLITNLPRRACVEVPCMVDRNGINPCHVGDLPEVCAAVNRTNINVHLLTVEAALTKNRDCIHQAAMLDPHTAAELTIDQIRDLCNDLIQAHGDYLRLDG